MGIDLVMQRPQLGLLGESLLVHSLGYQRINRVHQLGEMMGQLPDFPAAADAEPRIRFPSPRFFHRLGQPAQILQDKGIQHIGNSCNQNNKADIESDNQIAGMRYILHNPFHGHHIDQ
ncbi:hypothetical protein D3C86_1945720 [compost metagenome]